MDTVHNLPLDVQEIVRSKFVHTVRSRALQLAHILDHIGMLYGHLKSDTHLIWLQHRRLLYAFASEQTPFRDFLVKLTRLGRDAHATSQWMQSEMDTATQKTFAVMQALHSKPIRDMTKDELKCVLRLCYVDLEAIQQQQPNHTVAYYREIVGHIQHFLYGDRSYDQLKTLLSFGVGATPTMMTMTQYGAFRLGASIFKRLPMLLQNTVLDTLPPKHRLQDMTCDQVQEILRAIIRVA